MNHNINILINNAMIHQKVKLSVICHINYYFYMCNKIGKSTSVILLDGEMLRSTIKSLKYLLALQIIVVEREKETEYSVIAVTFSHRQSGTLKNHTIEIKNHITQIAKKYYHLINFGLTYIYKRHALEIDKRCCIMI